MLINDIHNGIIFPLSKDPLLSHDAVLKFPSIKQEGCPDSVKSN